MNIGEQPKAIETPYLPCDTVYDSDFDIYNYPVDKTQTCGCSVCDSNCTPIDWTDIIKEKSIFDGISAYAIYLIIFLLLTTASAYLFSYIKKRNQGRNRFDSFDSYDRIKQDLIK